jgi:hypothetical protein
MSESIAIPGARPKCKLIGTDGNVFCIIGRVSAALKGAGQGDRAKEFMNKATGCGSYDEVLAMLSDYVEVQ